MNPAPQSELREQEAAASELSTNVDPEQALAAAPRDRARAVENLMDGLRRERVADIVLPLRLRSADELAARGAPVPVS
jgi:hypothetical protein